MLQLATPADRERVNELALQVHAMHVSWRPDLYETVPELYTEARFLEEVKQRQLYVAKVDNVTVGYVLLKIRNSDMPGLVRRKVMVLDEICVDTICCGHGIGTQMVDDVRALAKAFRCTDMELGVYPQNDDAVGFFQKCGFMIRRIEMQCKV